MDASLSRLKETGILVSSLIKTLNARGLRKVVLAVDACCEQVATTKGLTVVGIAGASGGNGTAAQSGDAALTLYATKAGWYSYEDKNGRNGVFTRFMLAGLSGSADGAGPSGLRDGFVTFSELAAWLPDATASYALDQGLRQQAVSYSGAGDISTLDVTVSRSASIPASIAAPSVAAPAAGGAAADAADASADNIHAFISAIKEKVNTAVAESMKKENNGSKAAETAAQEKPAQQADQGRQSGAEPPTAEPAVNGFSILQFGLFTPIQAFPSDYVIYGPSVGVIQTYNVKVFSLQAALIAGASTMGGIQTGLICTADRMWGLQAGALVNHGNNVYGAQVGFINTADRVYGAQIGLINTARELKGVQLGFINVLEKRGLLGNFMFGLNIGY